MQGSRAIRLGCVKYLNARPLIAGWSDRVVFDHPAALSRQLERGEVDLALVSSFEFLRNPIYRIVNEISISCDGPVYSVVVAHRGEISDLARIALDPASLTSVALLRCLLAHHNLRPQLIEVSDGSLQTQEGRLLIGDQAIHFRGNHPDISYWDLGEAWKRATNLPFVFALWLVRPEMPGAHQIADRLRSLRDGNIRQIDRLIAAERDFDPEFCRRYFLQHLRFSFGESEKNGLRTFAELCAKQGLIPKSECGLDLI